MNRSSMVVKRSWRRYILPLPPPSLPEKGFSFTPLCGFIGEPGKKSVILRHDVDRLPGNSLAIAQMEHASGIIGSYYFRIVSESYDEGIIREISLLGHEIGCYLPTP